MNSTQNPAVLINVWGGLKALKGVAFRSCFLAFCATLLFPVHGQTLTRVNVLVDARGYAGAATTNQTVQSQANLAVELDETRSWSRSAPFGGTDSSATARARAEVGRLRFHAHGIAEAEITGAPGGLLAVGRGRASALWQDRFTVNAGPLLSNQVGELIATIIINGDLIHTADRIDAGLYFTMSAALVSTAGGLSTNFHGGTQLRPDNHGVVQTLPLDGMLVGPGVYQVPMRFHFGRPANLAVSCQADADASEYVTNVVQGRMKGESIGGHSLVWGGVSQVRLVGGGDVADFTITSDSGYDYLRGTSPSSPVIDCVTSQTVECGSVVSFTPPVVIDPACPNPGVVTMAGLPVTNGPPCLQEITLTWQYTNCWRQSAACIQTILVRNTSAPACLYARGTSTLTDIIVGFSEVMDATSAEDVFNYSVSGFVVIHARLLPGGTNVLLSLDGPLTAGEIYQVNIANVADLAGNPIAPSPCTLTICPSACPPAFIGLNFGADEFPNSSNAGTLPPGTSAGVFPQMNWNNLTGANGSLTAVVADSAGTPRLAAASVTWSSPNTWSTTGRGEENNGFPVSSGNRTLMTGYLDTTDAESGVASVTVSRLGPEFTGPGYTVIVYALGDVAGRGGAYSIGSVTNFGTSSANPSAFVQDQGLDHTDTGNYLVFSGLHDDTFSLIANAAVGLGSGSPGRAPVNAIQIVANPPGSRNGVAPGHSGLIGALDYSDTFTGTEDGGRQNRVYDPAAQPAPAYLVENTYGSPPVSFNSPGFPIGQAEFSFAADKADTPGLVNGFPSYPLGLAPDASGAGSDTGMTQTGGSVDYALPYNGLRSHFVVQVDAVQTGDRVDISCGASPGVFAPQSISVFFRGDGSGNASLFNGSVDTPIRNVIREFNTGITGNGQWHNYAVRFDLIAHEIELYVNQISVGVIHLATFAGGLYENFSTAWVGAGAGLGGGETRVWTDNFQVGAPVLTADCPRNLLVTTTADIVAGSLRAAIECANSHPGLDVISFAIPGAGPQTIRPLSPLPAITDPVVINGLSQPGATPNSQPTGNNAQLKIEIDGSLITSASPGLFLQAGNSVLRGLAINLFDDVGILLSSPSNVVEGCFIGTDINGSAALQNVQGIVIDEAGFNRIGGPSPASRNVISGNRYSGVSMRGAKAVANRVQGNYIGVDASGLNPLGNGTSSGNGAGVAISGGAFNLIGGSNPGEGNVISANQQSNVLIAGDTNTVQGNLVGPDVTGTRSLSYGGGYYGLLILGGTGNLIGGSAPGAGNLISGNVRGIDVIGPGTVIAGNRIGTDVSGTQPLGNVVHGILCYPAYAGGDGSFGSVIGGTNEGSGNIIAFNNADGVKVEANNNPPHGIRILGNSIHNNLGLGIDLSVAQVSDGTRGDGPTPPDSGDTDGGPNRLQNHPMLASARLAGGNVVIDAVLNSQPNETYRIEIFANTVADSSGYGEGEEFLGAGQVTTDATGAVAMTLSPPTIGGKLFFSATATDAAGNTSEFSPTIGLTAGLPIPHLWNTGVDADGHPLPDNATEEHYLLASGGLSPGTPFVAKDSGGFPIPPWLGDNAASAWIAPAPNTEGSGATDGSAVYRYETVFDLTGFDPSGVVISGRWSTDNVGRDILINGTSTGQANFAQFGAWTSFHIRGGFVAGLNRLTFLVSNGEGEPSPSGPTGLRVEMNGVGTLNQPLAIEKQADRIAFKWPGAGFVLQAAEAVTGPWVDIRVGINPDGEVFEVPDLGERAKFLRFRPDRSGAVTRERLRANSTVPVIEERTQATIRFLSFHLPWDSGSTPAERALAFLTEYADLFGLENPSAEFRINRVVHDAIGSHVFLTQHRDERDVLGGEIAVHLTDDAVTGFNGAYISHIPVGMATQVDELAAIAAAKAGSELEAAVEILGTAELILFNASLWMTPRELEVRGLDADTHLAWQLTAFQRDGRRGLHVVDAMTGAVLVRIPVDKTHTAALDLLVSSAKNWP